MSECPCCGQTLPDPLPLGLKLVGVERALLERIVKAGKHGIRGDLLFNYIYCSDPDGGPLTGLKVLSVVVWKLNKKLKPLGKKIKSDSAGGRHVHANYTVVDL